MFMGSAIKFHMPSPNGSLVTATKQESKHNLHTAATLWYTTKKKIQLGDASVCAFILWCCQQLGITASNVSLADEIRKACWEAVVT
jgi:hypothetical protein